MNGAIVVFVVLFGGGLGTMVYFITYRPWIGKRRCHRELPGLVERHGIQRYASNMIRGFSTFGGRVRDHQVWLDVDHGAIKIWLHDAHDLELEQQPPAVKPSRGWTGFDSSSAALKKRFKTRYASAEVAQRLSVASPGLDRLDHALRRLGPGFLRLRGDLLQHHPLNVRFPEYIPTGKFDETLTALLDLACALDDVLPPPPDHAARLRQCRSCGAVRKRYRDSTDYGSCCECSGSDDED